MSIDFKTQNSWAGMVARRIDKTYLNSSHSYLNAALYFMYRRVLLGLFVVCTAWESVLNVGRLAFYGLGSLLGFNGAKPLFQESLSLAFNAVATTILSILGGWLYPKMVAIRFLRKEEGLAISGSKIYQSHSLIKFPQSVADVKAEVVLALQNKQKVSIRGFGASQGKQYLAPDEGVMLDLAQLNKILEVSKEDKTVTVEAGARWADIQQVINRHGLALKIMQASNIFSVGGSLSANIHGWDHQAGTLSEVVRSVTIINADGLEVEITKNHSLFRYVIGGYGQFGVIVRATIELCDNDMLTETSKMVKVSDYVDHFRKEIEAKPETNRMHLYRLSIDPNSLLKEGVSVTYVKDQNQEQPIKVDMKDEPKRGNIVSRVLLHAARNFRIFRHKYWALEKNRLLTHKDVKTRNQWMRADIEAMFNDSQSEAEWLQEFFLPQDQLNSFIEKLSDLLTAEQVRLLNCSVRFVKEDKNTALPFAKGGDRFAVVLCFTQDLDPESILKSKIWIQKAIDITLAHKGTYYLPYQHFAKPEQFQASYPDAPTVHLAKSMIDPKSVFSNGFAQAYIGQIETEMNMPYHRLKNLEFREKFRGFLENILQQVDADKFYDLFLKVTKHTVSWEDAYIQLQKEFASIRPGTLAQIKQTFGALSRIKADLSSQAKTHMAGLEGADNIQGYLEIGYPGRFIQPLRDALGIKGKAYVMHEVESITDYVQTSSMRRPYDRFMALDYNHPKASIDKVKVDNAFKKGSLDLISCFVGLHHFPKEELGYVCQFIADALQEGGHFLLLDHDVTDEESFAMASLAHSVYNIATGETVKNELTEIRNFHSVDYWTKYLAKFGLVCTGKPGLLRNGDPSLNTMLCFTKQPALELELKNDEQHDFEPIAPLLKLESKPLPEPGIPVLRATDVLVAPLLFSSAQQDVLAAQQAHKRRKVRNKSRTTAAKPAVV